MIFHLDYSRRSDLDDTVGYWYVQPRGPEECRVYYSCVTKLRGWVPGPVYAMMTKTALQQTTSWLDVEAVNAWALQKAEMERSGGVGRLRRRLLERTRGMRGQLPVLPALPALPALPVLPTLPSAKDWWLGQQQQRRQQGRQPEQAPHDEGQEQYSPPPPPAGADDGWEAERAEAVAALSTAAMRTAIPTDACAQGRAWGRGRAWLLGHGGDGGSDREGTIEIAARQRLGAGASAQGQQWPRLISSRLSKHPRCARETQRPV